MKEDVLSVQLQVPGGQWVNVGYLHDANNRIWFEFEDKYWGLSRRPVLGQVFEERGRTWIPSSRGAIPNWFSHLLPEGRLLQAVASASGTDTKHEFDLLRMLGASDLPGAVRAVEIDFSKPGKGPAEPEANDTLADDDPVLKFSLAGAQLKFSVFGNGNKGITVPAAGQVGNIILKFPDDRSGFLNIPECELACLRLAAAAGMDAATGQLVSPRNVSGLERWAEKTTGDALAVGRFDRRPDNSRVHMEEFAQIMAIPTAVESAKYKKANFETIAVFAGALCGTEVVADVIDRIVLNVLIGNGDAHLKNWAVLYNDGRIPSLSPLYDVVPTVLYIPKDDLGLKLNKSRLFEDVTDVSFRRIGERTGFGAERAQNRAREATERVLSEWHVLSEHLPKNSYANLTDRLKSLPLAHSQ